MENANKFTFLNSSSPSAPDMHPWNGSALVQVMACRLVGTKPLPEPTLIYCERMWSGGWSTCTVDWLSASERGQYMDGWVSRDKYQVLGSTSIPTRLDILVYCDPFSWVTSVGTTRNTVIRLGWSRIGLAVLILHAAGVGLTDRPAVISSRYNKYHPLQLQNYYAHFPPLQHTHIHANTTMQNWSWEWSWVSRHCMLAMAGGILCAHWSLRGLMVKSAEHCAAEYKPFDRYCRLDPRE